MKVDIHESYYHVYARGVNKGEIFRDDSDYNYFVSVCRRYLSAEDIRNSAGISYDKLYENVQVLCYCLMPNHFHLLLYQVEPRSMERLMRGIMTAYSMYFNRKYKRRGPLFESRYKASRIDSDAYLEHITRYIHLNPRAWRTWPYSSLADYLGQSKSDWVQPGPILELFDSRADYRQFVGDYEAAKRELDSLKHQLADDETYY